MSGFDNSHRTCGVLKRNVRTTVLAARRDLPDGVRAEADAALLQALRAELAGHRTIAGYMPVGAEPGGPSLPDALAAAVPGGRVLLPVVLPDLDLDWAYYTGHGDLRTARLGLREPTDPPLGRDAIARADLLVVPALAVDRAGVRLGRGGGCYDRALARVPTGVPVLALLYAGELVDELPTQPHDRRVTGALVAQGREVLVWRR